MQHVLPAFAKYHASVIAVGPPPTSTKSNNILFYFFPFPFFLVFQRLVKEGNFFFDKSWAGGKKSDCKLAKQDPSLAMMEMHDFFLFLISSLLLFEGELN